MQSNQSQREPQNAPSVTSLNTQHDNEPAARVGGQRRKKRNKRKKNKNKSEHHRPIKCQDPIQFLPSIAANIFSRLSQGQCLAVMGVSKLWLERVPDLSKEIWHTVKLLGSGNDHRNTLLHRCLGPHVQQLVLEEFSYEDVLLEMMQVLQKHNCTELTMLLLVACTIVEYEQFLKNLKPLVQRLTQMEITQHKMNIHFIGIMGICPRLQTFDFTNNAYAEPQDLFSREPYIDPECGLLPDKGDTFDHITYLCISATIHNQSRLIPILKRCPRLRYLRVGGSKGKYVTPYSPEEATAARYSRRFSDGFSYRDSSTTDLETVMNLCPYLHYLEFNNCHNLTNIVRLEAFMQYHREIVSSDIPKHGLKLLNTRELSDYGPQKIIPFIKRHLATLEYLYLGVLVKDWDTGCNWSGLRAIRSHALRHLCCTLLDIDALALATMIEQCPRLEGVRLIYCGYSNDLSVIKAIDKLQHLTTLYFFFNLDHFFHCCNYRAIHDLLQKFVWMGTENTLTDIGLGILDDAILNLLGQMKNLNRICLINITEEVTFDGLFGFITRMQFNNTVVSLRLGGFRLIPVFFRVMATMQALKHVDVSTCETPGNGIQFLVERAPSLIKVEYNEDGIALTAYIHNKHGKRTVKVSSNM